MSNTRTYSPTEMGEHASNPTVEYMIRNGVPLNRENYLIHAYGGDMPSAEDWNHEHELMVPQPFQDPEAVKSQP